MHVYLDAHDQKLKCNPPKGNGGQCTFSANGKPTVRQLIGEFLLMSLFHFGSFAHDFALKRYLMFILNQLILYI